MAQRERCVALRRLALVDSVRSGRRARGLRDRVCRRSGCRRAGVSGDAGDRRRARSDIADELATRPSRWLSDCCARCAAAAFYSRENADYKASFTTKINSIGEAYYCMHKGIYVKVK